MISEINGVYNLLQKLKSEGTGSIHEYSGGCGGIFVFGRKIERKGFTYGQYRL
jgi:hypothetical protein